MKLVPHGEPYAGKLHVWFDEGAGVPDNKGRPALLYTLAPPSGGLSCPEQAVPQGLVAQNRLQMPRASRLRRAAVDICNPCVASRTKLEF